MMATPGLGTLLGRVMPAPSPDSVRMMMAGMGEGETIGLHPTLIDAMVAAGSDPVAGEVSSAELSSMIRGLLGFRPQQRITGEELARMTNEVLLLWGTKDPVDAGDAVEEATRMLPNARSHVLDAGHAPWLGDPARIADLIRGFLDN